MKKTLLTLSVLMSGLVLTGCVVAPEDAYPYPPSNTRITTVSTVGNTTLQYTYGNGYYYDSTYDYYDGLYGAFVGNVWYVYRSDGTRYIAPPPRYKNPRFTGNRWPGYTGNYNWMYRPNINNFNKPINNYRPNNDYWRNDRPNVSNVRPVQPVQPIRPNRPEIKPDNRPNNYNHYDNVNNQNRNQFNNRDVMTNGVFKPDARGEIKPNRPGGDWGRDREFNRER